MHIDTRIALIALLASTLAPWPHASAQVMPAARIMPARMAVPPEPPPGMEAGDEPDMSAEPPPEEPEPAAGSMAPPPAGMATPFTPQETEVLKRMLESLDPAGQESMRAYYRDLGVDLDQALGLAAARSQQAQRGQAIAGAMRGMDFMRKPEAVLAARAKLGFGQVPHPNAEAAQPQEVAKWLHLQVMAGEWAAVREFLAKLPAAVAEPIYAAILQSLNRGDQGLLPEEVLALADASPADLKPWQLAALSKILTQAAARNGTGPLMAALRSGEGRFGSRDAESRRRTVDLLAAAGLLAESTEFITPVEEARAAGDAALLVVHARHKLMLAQRAGEGQEADALRSEAFRLLAEATLMERAAIDVRRESLGLAIAELGSVPRAQATEWLARVFANPALGPAALEKLALTASAIGNMQLEVEERAQAVLRLKESIDVLLARDDVDLQSLRIPLRMVTSALVGEMEQAVAEKGAQQFVARESQLLQRAIPGERWLGALEPSLAVRARKACIGIAVAADEPERALRMLDQAVAASPADARAFADAFLSTWTKRLRPETGMDERMAMFFAFYRDAMPMAPLTRGRQRRNLEQLDALLATLRTAGIEPRELPSVVGAFEACHARTEAYEREAIERTFGPIPAMPPATAVRLAATMAQALSGDWRSREAQNASGTKRSDAEIAELVDRGYGVAIDLVASAAAQQDESWQLAAMQASLTFDRLQFRQQAKKVDDPARQDEYRKAAFAAFADAANRYVDALARGDARDEPDVFLRWFGSAMGTAQLNFIRPDDLPRAGTVQDDQVDLLRKAMLRLDAEEYERHVAAFAAAVQDAVAQSAPEVKQRLVHHALRVIGDHPAGASLRSMDELYRDLVKDEIKLRLAVDGDDRVGAGRPFGALVSLRFTNSVDRETGGFSKYLMNGVFARVGNQFRQVNHRDELQKSIERALADRFDIEAIGFFDPYMPPRGVVEGGEGGWMEKPLAYLVLSRKDPAVAALPAVGVDMQFTDQAGPVTLEIVSNSVPLAVGDAASPRPCTGLEVEQLVDVRGAPEGAKDGVTLEVRMRGKGVVPNLRDALAGLDAPLAGFELGLDGIVADPPVVVTAGDPASMRTMMMTGQPSAPKDGYPEPDADGMYRLPIERTWRVTYLPTGMPSGGEFVLPRLAADRDATLVSKAYQDLDVVTVTGSSVPVERRMGVAWALGAVGAGLLAVASWFVLRRKPGGPHAIPEVRWAPGRLTALGVVTSLRRLERERAAALGDAQVGGLRDEIRTLELKWFGPDAAEASEAELRDVVARWSEAVR
jgi:hypothetical protein